MYAAKLATSSYVACAVGSPAGARAGILCGRSIYTGFGAGSGADVSGA